MKKKLIGIFVLIGCLPLLIASMFFYYQFHDKVMRQNDLESERELAASEAQILNVVEDGMIVLRVLAGNPYVKAFDVTGAKPVLMNAQSVFSNLIICLNNAVGVPVARGDNTALNYTVTDRQFFKQSMTGKEFISEVILSRTTGQGIVVLSVPVREGQAVRGVLQGSITLENLGAYVKKVSNENRQVYILDREGKVLAHPDEKLAKERADMSKLDFVQRGLNGETGKVTTRDSQGREVIVHFTRNNITGWVVCSEAPKDIIMAGLNKMTAAIVFGIVLLIAVVCAAGYAFSARITKPIRLLSISVGEVAKGNLGIRQLNFHSKDEVGELGRAFDAMTTNLRTLVQQVSSSAEQVSASSEELTASSEQAAQAANQVAGSITTVSAGTDEQLAAAHTAADVVGHMSASIQQVAVNAQQVAAQAAQAADKAKDGDGAVKRAIAQMGHIENTVNTSAKVVTKLGERSQEIGQIVDAISGIAGQTNLLALNAAIEAARAGEAGRGFAVVAEEVRKLAEQSQEAAKKIAELIGEIQSETDKAVESMDEGTREVKTGTEVVQTTGATFQEIAGLVTEVSVQVKDISAAIQQMAADSQQIVGAVKKIDDLGKRSADEAQGVSAAAEQQLASMEEIASSGQALAKLAQDLQTAVGAFRM